MSEPQSQTAAFPTRWNTLGTGADLWATVVMAAGFVLPADQIVREHYRIVRTLGQGGMGQVLGVILGGSPDQQVYALKMVARPAGAEESGKPVDPADLRDAELQAKAFAALLRGEAAKQELVQRHGVSVARLFALVRFEDGALGLRMEVARGRSLEAFIEDESKQRASQPPDVDFCLLVIRKVLYQLRRLHELVDPSSPSGFVHSDMKPGNVFVDDGDRYDPHITLLDFGVATAGHALGVDRSGRGAGRKSLILNDAGGTFGFAPPHHFTGKPTPLSDVYAALVILYEMIALQSPWDFGGLAKSPANLFKLEDAMRKGPRSVRSGRACVPEPVAEALDRFFAEEFAALHALADRAHVARNAADDAVRTAMNDRLRSLAQGYQTKLEALRLQLTAGAMRSSDPAVELANAELARAPTQAVAMLPRRDVSATRVDAPSRRRTEPETVDSALVVSHEVDDPPVRVPMQPLIGWKSAVVVAIVGGTCAWFWIGGVRSTVDTAIRAVQERVRQGQTTRVVDAGNLANGVVELPDASIATHAASTTRVDASVATAMPDVATLEAPDVAVAAQLAANDVSTVSDATNVNVAQVVIDASAPIVLPRLVDASVAPIVTMVAAREDTGSDTSNVITPTQATGSPAIGAHAVPPSRSAVARPPTPLHTTVAAHAAASTPHAPLHPTHAAPAHAAAHRSVPAHHATPAVHRPAPRPTPHRPSAPAHRLRTPPRR